MSKINKIILFCFVILLVCCKKDDEIKLAGRTVLIYMAADNNLYHNAITDIKEMLKSTLPPDNNLLIYFDAPAETADSIPKLFRVENSNIEEIKSYQKHNSASGKVLEMVVHDAINFCPAISYGLVLWSHGTGWLPCGVYDTIKQKTPQRSFGKDNGNEMEITELAQHLPLKFQFIIFDACLMANIETVYQLRNNADIIIASPAEILVAGFPYDNIINLLFTQVIDYKKIAETYMNYYKNKTGVLQSATISVIETKYLKEFANNIKNIINLEINIPHQENVQRYEVKNALFYDLQNYLEQATSENFTEHFQKIVKYCDFTQYFLSELEIEKSCGISVFIHFDENLLSEYEKLDWFIDSNLLCRFD
jgi:hypothetical protein